MGSALHVMLFLENTLQALLIFNGLRSRHCQRALLGYHYPFKSNRDYNVLFAEQDGSRSAAQIKAFADTWRWDQAAAEAYQMIIEAGGKVLKGLERRREAEAALYEMRWYEPPLGAVSMSNALGRLS